MGNKDEIGKLIRFYRKSRHLTQKDVATMLEWPYSRVAMYETGKREPDADSLEALADVFNISLRDLMPDKSTKTPSRDDTARLEALHQNPRLGLLFDRISKMSEDDISFMEQFADRVLKERDD